MTTLNLSSLLGLTESDAVTTIEAAEMKARVRSREGQAFIGTCDYRTDRVNLHIMGGKVTKATIG